MNENLSNTLITGANGMVGGYIDFGIKTNHESLDVTNLSQFLEIAKEYKPSIVIHLAAETDVDKCEREPKYAYFVNAIGSYNAALVAKSLNAKLVYISTVYIFDGEKKADYREGDQPNPQSFYSRSKLLGELAIQGTLKDYLILRAGWMMGGGPEYDKKFVGRIMGQLSEPQIKAVGDRFGSITYGKDLIDKMKELLLTRTRGLFHVYNEGCVSRYELALEIVKLKNSRTKAIEIGSEEFREDAPRGKYYCMGSNSVKMRPWKEAIKDYLENEWPAIT